VLLSPEPSLTVYVSGAVPAASVVAWKVSCPVGLSCTVPKFDGGRLFKATWTSSAGSVMPRSLASSSTLPDPPLATTIESSLATGGLFAGGETVTRILALATPPSVLVTV
jgi:hypothetical protein